MSFLTLTPVLFLTLIPVLFSTLTSVLFFNTNTSVIYNTNTSVILNTNTSVILNTNTSVISTLTPLQRSQAQFHGMPNLSLRVASLARLYFCLAQLVATFAYRWTTHTPSPSKCSSLYLPKAYCLLCSLIFSRADASRSRLVDRPFYVAPARRQSNCTVYTHTPYIYTIYIVLASTPSGPVHRRL